ncbi:MAG: zinc ribbon domain-containing protein [Zavarzinella sp.]
MAQSISCPSCQTVLGIPPEGIPKSDLECMWCGNIIGQTASEAPQTPQPPQIARKTASRTQEIDWDSLEDEPAPKPVAEKQPPRVPKKAAPPPKEAPPTEERPVRQRNRGSTWAVTEDLAAKETKPPPRPVFEEEDDEENANPYIVEEIVENSIPCRNCGKRIPDTDLLCTHCGYNHETGEVIKRTFPVVNRYWDTGMSRKWRWRWFGIAVGIDLFFYGARYLVLSLDPVEYGTLLFTIFLQAFLLGSYPALQVRRDSRGRSRITSYFFICLYPVWENRIRWQDHESVAIGPYSTTGITDWLIFLIFLSAAPTAFALAGWGKLIWLVFTLGSAALWYFLVIFPERFAVSLTKGHGASETYVYRGPKQAKAQEIMQTITDCTGLPLEHAKKRVTTEF